MVALPLPVIPAEAGIQVPAIRSAAHNKGNHKGCPYKCIYPNAALSPPAPPAVILAKAGIHVQSPVIGKGNPYGCPPLYPSFPLNQESIPPPSPLPHTQQGQPQRLPLQMPIPPMPPFLPSPSRRHSRESGNPALACRPQGQPQGLPLSPTPRLGATSPWRSRPRPLPRNRGRPRTPSG